MRALLLKKQLREIFRRYFYNAKTNKRRSKAGVILYFFFFALLMVGILGGMLFLLSFTLCEPLCTVGAGWVYFCILGGIGILLGAFGSVFNTYSSLYLAKDNDLLFSLPIPVEAIMTSRLLSVYLMGLMYSAVATLPASIVYWITVSASVPAILGGLLLVVLVSGIVMVLSCALGYVVARVSLRVKNKNFGTVVLSLVLVVGYYYFYFKANDQIQNLILHAAMFGKVPNGPGKLLWYFGSIGEGSFIAMGVWTLAVAVACLLTWQLIRRSFLKIATSTGVQKRTVYRERRAVQRSLSRALLSRELRRFAGSANYMLNCGLGILLLPLAGIALLWKGGDVTAFISAVFGTDAAAVLLISGLCLASTMIDPAAPAVSLEGKNLWIVRSLPVLPWQALRAKLHLQLTLSVPPMLFSALCVAGLLRKMDLGALVPVLGMVYCLAFAVFLAVWALFWGVRMPNLQWTSEIYPIKQSAPVNFAIFGGWAFAVAMGALYFWQGKKLGLELFLAAGIGVFALASIGLYLWLRKRGAALFGAL